jgi:hypothetical protein
MPPLLSGISGSIRDLHKQFEDGNSFSVSLLAFQQPLRTWRS